MERSGFNWGTLRTPLSFACPVKCLPSEMFTPLNAKPVYLGCNLFHRGFAETERSGFNRGAFSLELQPFGLSTSRVLTLKVKRILDPFSRRKKDGKLTITYRIPQRKDRRLLQYRP